jgi:two-component system phosphate regulon response regulator PhoB
MSPAISEPQKLTVLVAEDDDFLSRVLIDKLEKENFKTIAAVDGEQAIQKIKTESIDLIILDMIMPKKTGFDVIDEVKNNPASKDIPIIILSNLGQESDIEQAKQKGVNDYLVKANISMVSVVQKIRAILG